ncbi:cytochrome P450 [Aspergillus pseudocaelatus]|uniref:Cytochrome P450 n=1 Tax=Aspergillus pseudocaelatus TaxID=1825620 RepID=A0ABQ6WMJ3_9EURO|nr:cytochrome P450 [Aspergillus pseudocaelatus]
MDVVGKFVLLGATLILSRFIWNCLRPPLKSFPGPFNAKLTNLWRLQVVFKGRCDITHNELHRRHGPAVCIGPNVLSLPDSTLINQVYSTRGPWAKSDMYNVNDSVVSGVRIKNLFSHQDEQWHTNAEQYQERLTEGEQSQNGYGDFLDRYIEAKGKMPDIVDDNVVQMYLLSNIVAGSDTTASAICAAVYYVLKNTAVYNRLQEELRGTNLSTPPQWKEARSLPYLDAVMREAMRVHPGVGLLLERIVPRDGLTLSGGRFVPEGTIVGMNPWVVNRDSTVFGSEPDSFKPERWLPAEGEDDEAYQTRFSKMKSTDLTFGAGPRACLGRHISQSESYKFVATLFTNFDVELKTPDYEWEVTNSWFVRQKNIPVIIKERKS